MMDLLQDICDAGLLPGTPMRNATKVFAMNWRFFPTLDPQVLIWLSVLNLKESQRPGDYHQPRTF